MRRRTRGMVAAVSIAAVLVLALSMANLFDLGDENPPSEPSPRTEVGPETPQPTEGEQSPETLPEAFGDLECLLAEPVALAEERGSSAARVLAIARAVEEIRGLRFEEVVEPRFVSPEGIRKRTTRLFRDSYPRGVANDEGLILSALGVVEPGTDMRALRRELIGGQVAGFYVPETGELVVARSGKGIGAVAEITLSHELEHALADQNLHLPVDSRTAPGEEDADLAALAVVEGDATLTMQRFSASLPLGDQLAALADPTALGAADDLATFPHFLQQELMFPYLEGLRYVCERFADGGWRAVDRAYRRAPASTAEVLFGHRDRPADLRDPAVPSGWSARPARSFGAAPLLWLLESPGNDPTAALPEARAAASTWAGGEVHLFTREDRSAIALVLRAREGAGSVLCGAIERWFRAAFPTVNLIDPGPRERLAARGTDSGAALRCSGREVRLGLGPGLGPARAVAR